LKIAVRVLPNSKTNSIERIGNAEYRVKVSAKAVGGKANEAVILVLAEHFKVKKHSIRIVSGALSKNKVIEVANGAG